MNTWKGKKRQRFMYRSCLQDLCTRDDNSLDEIELEKKKQLGTWQKNASRLNQNGIQSYSRKNQRNLPKYFSGSNQWKT